MSRLFTQVLMLSTLTLLSDAAFSQQGTDSVDTPAPSSAEQIMKLFSTVWEAPSSFPAHLQIAKLARRPDAKYGTQLAATLAAELGLYEQAVSTFPLGPGKVDAALAPLPPESDVVADAADAIAGLARNRKIVIVNEAHHVAQTRVLFLDLLPRLREAGFTHYCAETLFDGDVPHLQKRGYPVRRSGAYSREPVFGEALRMAAKLGYTLCDYEAAGDKTQQDRETGQADNLATLLRENPDARILVHAGYGHARKDRTVADARPMAAELKRLTGIAPLTINQTTLRADVPQSRENPAYRPLLARLQRPTRASVFIDAAGKPWSLEPAGYDISVILPDLPASHGRPGWLWTIPGKQVVADFNADCLGKYPCAIEARHAGESDDAVPADVVVRESADGSAPALALFPGAYRLMTIAPDGGKLYESTLTVAAPDSPATQP